MLKINDVKFVGRITAEPELKAINDTRNVINATVAVDDSYYDSTNKKEVERTQWVPIKVYGPRADALSKNAPKGKLIYFEGKLVTDQWTDEATQKKHSRMLVEVSEWQFAEPPKAKKATEGEAEG